MTTHPVNRRSGARRGRAELSPTDAASVSLAGRQVGGVVFDMDAVIANASGIQDAAWKQTLAPILGQAGAEALHVEADYRPHVDGRSRDAAIRAALAGRGLSLPEGDRDDPPGTATVWGLANRMNEAVADLLRAGGCRSFSPVQALMRRLRHAQIPVAVVAVGHDAVLMLRATGTLRPTDVVVDGDTAERLRLPGKPDPALFLEAARRLGLSPGRVAVIEETVAGVQAARRGGFGLILGVDPSGRRDDLLAAGADLVVADLHDLPVSIAPATGAELPACMCGGGRPVGGWRLVYDGFDPAVEGRREALCTTGNGYLGSRGAAPEAFADPVHYPGTYLAGVYNRLTTQADGAVREDEHLVNVPNWLPLQFRTGDGEWFDVAVVDLLDYRQELDLAHGELTRTLRFRDDAGHVTRVHQSRLVSMAQPHLAVLRTEFVAEDWSGPLHVRSLVDGDVVNGNVADDRALANRHLRILTADANGETAMLLAETTGSGIRIAVATRTRVTPSGGVVRRRYPAHPTRAGHELTVPLTVNRPVVVDKVAAYVTSRDPAIASPLPAARAMVDRAGAYQDLLADHAVAWDRLWARHAVEVDGPVDLQLAVNLHTYHLLTALSPHTKDVDAGIGARGLHGEGYRGHVFWDEVFVLPVLNLRQPDLARTLLAYRHRRLPAARNAARDAGHAGAMFPWQSGSDGREETPSRLFNPRSGRWMPDNSRRQRHVGIAVAYDAWQHYQTTGDQHFLAGVGADLLIEVARGLTSLASYDAADDRYHIRHVMGPDEFHDGYPDAPGSGVTDNAYTNVMTAWVLCRALDTVRLLAGHHCGEVWDRLTLSESELERWDTVSRRLSIPFHTDGVLSQFAGYQDLREFDWDGYRARYGNIGRLDLILEAEGDSPNRYRLAKQADTLMLLYLLSAEELRDLLHRLGDELDAAAIQRTVDFYAERVAHGSTLSRVAHAWVLARADRSGSFEHLRHALDADLADTQGGTTPEGVHLGAMAGTLDLLTRCYPGLEVRDEALWLNPTLPDQLRRLRFSIDYRGHWVTIQMDPHRLLVHLRPCDATPITLVLHGRRYRLHAGRTRTFALRRRAVRS